MKMLQKLLAVTAIALFSQAASAAFIPFGVWNNVATSTITNSWGWTECYSAAYNDGTASVANILGGCQGDKLMLGARATGSSEMLLIGAADYDDVTFDTGTGNTTHNANGIEWYYNDNYSWGFAKGGDAVSRNSCDTAGTNADQRLCWHTHNSFAKGWRAGANTSLNNSSAYEKVVFVLGAANVPEPLTIALFGLGSLLMGRRMKHR